MIHSDLLTLPAIEIVDVFSFVPSEGFSLGSDGREIEMEEKK